ncbi:MAG: Wzt carbohydrate-binding domain-containing protein, partial [Candidatus Nanopelagicales bacterium]
LEGLCDEIAWLEHGVLQERGPAVNTIAAYLRRVNAEEASRNPMVAATRDDDGGARAGDQSMRVRTAAIVDTQGESINHAETGTTFSVRLGLSAAEPVLGPNIRIALQHESGPLVAMISNHQHGYDLGMVPAGDLALDMALLDNPLLPGRYRVHIDVFDHTGSRLLDSWNDAVEFAVRSASGEIGQGFVRLPARTTRA